MGQIEWAMWANEQALASGLSEWGRGSHNWGLQRVAEPGARAGGNLAGGPGGWGGGREQGPGTPGCRLRNRGRSKGAGSGWGVLMIQEVGWRPRDWMCSSRRAGIWGLVLGAGCSHQSQGFGLRKGVWGPSGPRRPIVPYPHPLISPFLRSPKRGSCSRRKGVLPPPTAP